MWFFAIIVLLRRFNFVALVSVGAEVLKFSTGGTLRAVGRRDRDDCHILEALCDVALVSPPSLAALP